MECIFCGKKYKRESAFFKHYYEEIALFGEALRTYTEMSLEDKSAVDAWHAAIEDRFDRIYRQPDLARREELNELFAECKRMHEEAMRRLAIPLTPLSHKHYAELRPARAESPFIFRWFWEWIEVPDSKPRSFVAITQECGDIINFVN
jgi:hypothetical protein